MIVVAAVCLAAAVVLAVALVRTRQRVAELDATLEARSEERNAAQLEAASAHDRAAAARRERDDAFDRVQRARRDAAEVAGRLRDESAARAEAEAVAAEESARAAELASEVADTRAAMADCTAALDGLRSRGAPSAPSSGPGDLEVLWDLALARAERTWRTSISLSVDDECPLESSDQRLRAAVEIEIDAAREEAGADIDLCWTGEAAVPPATAVVVFSLVESAIAEVAKSAEKTTVHVAVGDDQVELRIEAFDDSGRALAVRWPSVVSEVPGEARVPLVRSSAEDATR